MRTWNELLSADEIALVSACLRAAEEGPFFPEWEFQTLFGVERRELAEIRSRWPSISLDDDVAYLSVMNSVANLVGYPHGEEAALQKYVAGGEGKLERLARRLAKLKLDAIRRRAD
jgi:hypothetical protein